MSVRPAPEVELTFDNVATPGVTSAQVVEFVDNRGAAVSQNLKDFFPLGSPRRALVPERDRAGLLSRSARVGPPGRPRSCCDRQLDRGLREDDRVSRPRGVSPRLGPALRGAVRPDPGATHVLRAPPRSSPPWRRQLFGGNPAFVDISSGCGSNKGAGWNFSVYLTARDTRTPLQIAQFMLDRMQGALTSLAAFIINPTVAASFRRP